MYLSSAFILFQGLTAEENVSIDNVGGDLVVSAALNQINIVASPRASIASFQAVLRTTTYFSTRPLE